MKNITKQQLFWLMLTVLSIGTLTGCQYCAPVLLALLTSNAIYTVSRPLIEPLQKQALN